MVFCVFVAIFFTFTLGSTLQWGPLLYKGEEACNANRILFFFHLQRWRLSLRAAGCRYYIIFWLVCIGRGVSRICEKICVTGMVWYGMATWTGKNLAVDLKVLPFEKLCRFRKWVHFSRSVRHRELL